jgi:hypothetical protein
MKNQIQDLNDHLFSALERLGDEQLEGDKLKAEIERCKAVGGVAAQVVNLYSTVIDGARVAGEYRMKENPLLLVSKGATPAIEGAK